MSMMIFMNKKQHSLRSRWTCIAVLLCLIPLIFSGCVDQHPKNTKGNNTQTESAETMIEITDPEEKAAVEAAKVKTAAMSGEPRIIATSPAVAEICDKLDLDLAGVCKSSVSTIPKRYKKVKKVGTAMSPDMEIVASLNPDWILSPSSLQSDLEAKYKNLQTDWAFLNLKSVPGMYRSIQELGEIFNRKEQAQKMAVDFTAFYKKFKKRNKSKKQPKVLILMGLPGSYVIATENSYVGSLVKMAGGKNVYQNTGEEFLNVNTENMKKKEPDIILRAAHALPDQVVKMFKEDFETNDIWKHFEAVEKGKVYDLTYQYFGMSANFQYPKALSELEELFYQKKSTGGEKGK